MTRWQLTLIAAVILAGGSFAAGLTCGSHHAAKQAVQAQTQSDQHEGAAQAHAAQAADLTNQGAVAGKAEANAEASVAIAKRDLADTRARLHTVPLTSPASLRADGAGSGVVKDSLTAPLPGFANQTVADSAMVIAKQDAVIQAQDGQIAALKLEVSIAHAEAAQWHQAYDESQKALVFERISKDAAVRSESKRGLLHSLEALAVGAVAGRFIK